MVSLPLAGRAGVITGNTMDTAAPNALTELHRNTVDRPVRALETIGRSLVECQRCREWDAIDGRCTRYAREKWAETLVFCGGICELHLNY